MFTELRPKSFNAYEVLLDYQKSKDTNGGANTDSGAESIFVGRMRNSSGDNSTNNVSKMFIEHYSPMTEQALDKIAQQAISEFNLLDALIIHRTGDIALQEDIVLIACWSTHRDAAINASRFLIEALKSSVPFWKKEWCDNKASWVNKNTAANYSSD